MDEPARLSTLYGLYKALTLSLAAALKILAGLAAVALVGALALAPSAPLTLASVALGAAFAWPARPLGEWAWRRQYRAESLAGPATLLERHPALFVPAPLALLAYLLENHPAAFSAPLAPLLAVIAAAALLVAALVCLFGVGGRLGAGRVDPGVDATPLGVALDYTAIATHALPPILLGLLA